MLNLQYNEMWNDWNGLEETNKLSIQYSYEKLVLSWKRLTVSVKNTEKKFIGSSKITYQQILANVSGNVQRGTLLGIMGPSGSGKTTLMATISYRTKGNFEGELLLNGESVTKEVMMKISSFIPQHELFFDTLTTLEHLYLMAKLKMDYRTTELATRNCVDYMVATLGMSTFLETRMSLLSTGERKKVALAVQLLNDPSILFCDEITTGLDSYTAAHIVNILKRIAESGKIVICTIHQPASGVFRKFNEVIFLKDGRLAYRGPVSMVNQFFQKFDYKCPDMFNESDFIISILNSNKEEVKRDVHEMCKLFSNDHQMNINYKSLNNQDYMQYYLKIKKPVWYVQFRLIYCRSMKCFQRDYLLKLLDVGNILVLSIFISAPYTDMLTTQNLAQNLEGFLYTFIINIIFNMIYCVTNIPNEQTFSIIHREIHNEVYPLSVYFFSELIISMIWMLIKLIVYCCPPILLIGLKWNFMKFVTLLFIMFASYSFGCIFSISFDSIDTCSVVIALYTIVALSISGAYILLRSLPKVMYYLRYISVFFIGFETSSILFWKDIKFLPCINAINCLNSGNAVLNQYSYQIDNFYIDIWIIIVFCALAQIYYYFGILRKIKKQPAY